MIVYLGWGSLVWQPRDLSMVGGWREDGPPVQVEYLRQSGNGRLTLVLSPNTSALPSFWTVYDGGEDVLQAKDSLRAHEKILPRNLDRHVGVWLSGSADPAGIPGLQQWAAAREIDVVLWTALPPKFNGEDNLIASADEVLTYLSDLNGEVRERAEEYIRRTPLQIATPYRRDIEQQLGWTPL
ncbi:hypothetical protein [Stenotrophomonas sp. PS02300]|uniref:hypothetical protein n=1 Tax=Stenotrophomonas sp. PS02300 TaxID=2991426 RepID=UPI00249C54ED|nr:hypothetical protein [Stenotrophomonas sp. PS02300]